MNEPKPLNESWYIGQWWKERSFKILLFLYIVYSLSWLIGENHGIYGDESAHHLFLLRAIDGFLETSKSSWLSAFWGYYKFNNQYPPLFYTLSIPFRWILEDVVAGRVYVAVLGGLIITVFYRVIRSFASSKVALLSGMLILASAPFAEITCFFLVETLIGLLTVLFLFFILRYIFLEDSLSVLWAGIVVSLGLLTKINFVIYILPICVFGSVYLVKSIKNSEKPYRLSIKYSIYLALPSIVLCAPWYISNLFFNQNNQLSRYIGSQDINLQPNNFSNLKKALHDISIAFKIDMPPIIFYLLILVLAIFIFNKVKARTTENKESEKFLNNIRFGLLLLGLVSIVYLHLLLFRIGLLFTPRWNLSYYFVSLSLACILSSISLTKLKNIFYYIFVFFFVVIIIYRAGYMERISPRNIHPGFTKTIISTVCPRGFRREVYRTTTGMEQVAKIISTHENSICNTSKRNLIPVLFHAHKGAHAVALSYYLYETHPKLQGISFINRRLPVNLDVFLKSNYLIVLHDRFYGDAETRKYVYFYNNLPQDYTDNIRSLGIVPSRFGRIEVLYRPYLPAKPETVKSLINLGLKYNRKSPYRYFWILRNLYYEFMEGNRSFSELQNEMTNLEPEISKTEMDLPRHIYLMLMKEKKQIQQDCLTIGELQKIKVTSILNRRDRDLLGSIDTLNDMGSHYKISGWCGSEKHRRNSIEEVWAISDDNRISKTLVNLPRPGVLVNYPKVQPSNSGFSIIIPKRRFDESQFQNLLLVAKYSDGALVLMPGCKSRLITLSPNREVQVSPVPFFMQDKRLWSFVNEEKAGVFSVIKNHEGYAVSGWSLIGKNHQIPDEILFTAGPFVIGTTVPEILRKDVMVSFDIEKPLFCGFEAQLSPALLPLSGKYDLSLYAKMKNGQYMKLRSRTPDIKVERCGQN